MTIFRTHLAYHKQALHRKLLRALGGPDPTRVRILMYAALKLTQPETNDAMKQVLTARVQEAICHIDPEYARVKGFLGNAQSH